jgi:hypothetical protein
MRAPCIIACAILPRAIRPSGTRTIGVIPARVAYAAIDADVLPVDAHTTAFAPCSAASDTATVMPRSLNEPVGLTASTFSHTEHPVRSDSHADSTSGVPPSPSDTIGVSSLTGSQSRYSSMTPRHCGAPEPLTQRLPRRASPT